MSASGAVIVGAGPNGLVAGIELARRGIRVTVLEAAESVGGGLRSASLTEPGYVHDMCASVFPMGVGSPALSALPLQEHGLRWVHPDVPLAHPLDGGRATVLHRSLGETASGLGRDGAAYRRLVGGLAARWWDFARDALGPIGVPRSPLLLARFAMHAVRSAASLARYAFREEEARALFAGCAAHSFLPLENGPSAAFGTVLLAAGHAVGWPFVGGGSQRLADALTSLLRAHGGEVRTGVRVDALEDLPDADAVLLDLAPAQLVAMAGNRLPERYRSALEAFEYGPAVFKLDWALDAPIPWAAEACRRAGTVHVGGTLDEIAAAERAVWEGRAAERPFVLLAQPSLFDPERAPAGRHTAWAYCHVPPYYAGDATAAIEAQIERFAPGFEARVLARSVRGPAQIERDNPAYVGGHVVGGVPTFRQLLMRPTPSLRPYVTPLPNVYLCSQYTPPGGGAHGMCG
ncbi:MAG: NAD(P)/FAD-dependent oxidoreductase, partial [Gemmatimonadota bacterium]